MTSDTIGRYLSPVVAGLGLACTPVTEVPFVLEDLSGTYLVAGVYQTLEAVNGVELCDGSGCASQVPVGTFAAEAGGQCRLSVGGIRLALGANGTFQLEGTRREECTRADGTVDTVRDALTVSGLYRLHGGGSDGLTVIQSVGTSGSYRLEGRLEGVVSVTAAGQIVPRYVHLGVRDRSRLEFTMTWTR